MLYLFLCTVIRVYMELERFRTNIMPLRPKLFLFARKMMQDDADAEDIVQEAFLKLWNIRQQLESINNPEGFAMQTVKNICIDKLRNRKNVVDTDEFHLESDSETPYLTTEVKDSVQIIRRIIDNLPGLQQQIIRMRDIEGYELEEIAMITGTQVNSVTVNLSRARKKVRDIFIKINNYRS